MYVYLCVYFFFFKQKTAYEMRISDWSSDVCSSDLGYRKTMTDQAPPPPPHDDDDAQEENEVLRAAREQRQQKEAADAAEAADQDEIGRASCRERVCQYV